MNVFVDNTSFLIGKILLKLKLKEPETGELGKYYRGIFVCQKICQNEETSKIQNWITYPRIKYLIVALKLKGVHLTCNKSIN